MAQIERLICAGAELAEGGRGVRFEVKDGKQMLPAFAIRYGGVVYAYLNRCAHVLTELDWLEGEFFDRSGLYLICSTHGATYEPATGYCIMGPCKGRRLIALQVAERDGNVYLHDGDNRYG